MKLCTEEELIEALSQIAPDWRAYYKTPEEAAEALIPDYGQGKGGSRLDEIDFDSLSYEPSSDWEDLE